jgi:4a-hydroxytetrahydrobiopterin dehydratase
MLLSGMIFKGRDNLNFMRAADKNQKECDQTHGRLLNFRGYFFESRRKAMDLKDKNCVPCSSYVPPLPQVEKEKLLQALSPEWKLTHDNTRLRKDFKFKNFKQALNFANEVGRIAEEEKHHPEIFLGWGHCDLEIWTHNNHNLLENDFILAAKIDAAFIHLYPPKS